jgi:hypothetical protein
MSIYLAECPHCPNKATTRFQVKELFGLRTMANGKIRSQSNCKKCRVRIQRQRKRLGLQTPKK